MEAAGIEPAAGCVQDILAALAFTPTYSGQWLVVSGQKRTGLNSLTTDHFITDHFSSRDGRIRTDVFLAPSQADCAQLSHIPNWRLYKSQKLSTLPLS